MYAAASNLTVFFPSTILLYRQFILQSSNALFPLTAGETGWLREEAGELGRWPGAASALRAAAFAPS